MQRWISSYFSFVIFIRKRCIN